MSGQIRAVDETTNPVFIASLTPPCPPLLSVIVDSNALRVTCGFARFYPRNSPGLLRLGDERRGDGASQRRQYKATTVHHGSIT